ncbi:hypothetical protein [Tardiphaga sp.]|jgi:hypothetical protein|uniref:hypothetical protein n=1 Tax=Tardiphaga sp. TaxID=1926292 RepID=UPI0037DA5BBC
MRLSVIEAPRSRRLRIFAFDPSLAQQMATSAIQEIVVRIPWERAPDGSALPAGPIGEYIEVIDIDPASQVVYPPVNLDDPYLLAQDGLPPSEGNPQFHQQMVYAVAMATIGHFERALGRVALWAPRRLEPKDSPTGRWRSEFVRRLRIYPHALRDQNAYYSPAKKALLFGYFPVTAKDRHNTPGTIVFACLSHDIVAHEVTHALLDGIHPRFNEPSNPDVHAFHEGFADIVAIFQHFSYPGVLRDQIMRARGQLSDRESMLGQLAQQFGRATGRGGALRDALGSEVKGKWRRRQPDPRALETTMEPHARGAILVAAVFGAFLLVYEQRTADLFRIATQGTGILPEGDISPDLANRLAEEASRCARDILLMCIRALDYCPPVGITFGTYLRAIVTGDVNLNADDDAGYRVPLVESFRAWGIYPRGIRSMSIEALVWPSGAEVIAENQAVAMSMGSRAMPSKAAVRSARDDSAQDIAALFDNELLEVSGDGSDASTYDGSSRFHKWDLSSERYQVWRNMEESRAAVWRWLVRGNGQKYLAAFGLVVDSNAPPTIYRDEQGVPTVEVHSVRTALRRDARGQTVTDVVIELTQRRRGYFDKAEQEAADARTTPFAPREDGDFKFRAGCTVVIDSSTNTFRHIIRTPTPIDKGEDLALVRAYLAGEAESDGNSFDGRRQCSLRDSRDRASIEPFAMLHRHSEE